MWGVEQTCLILSSVTDWSSEYIQERSFLSGGSAETILHHQPEPGCNKCF